MKISFYDIIAILLVVTAVALAGCSASKTIGTGSDSAAITGSVTSSSSAPSVAATTAATCPTINGKGAWDGAWTGFYEVSPAWDERVHFNPPDAKQNNYWQHLSVDNGWMNVTFTQNGCAVTGTSSIDTAEASAQPCQITYNGTASETDLKGTWKAYCNIKFFGAAPEDGVDNGIFDINMEPTLENTFIGKIVCDTDDCRKAIAREYSTADSNFVGKRV